MKLMLVTDTLNNSENTILRGAAYKISDDDISILFDCGCSEEFIKTNYGNSISLSEITTIVLGGNSFNETRGFARLKALRDTLGQDAEARVLKSVLAHPDVFRPRDAEIYAGFKFNKTEEEINKFFNLVLNKNSKYINHNFVYLGEKPMPKKEGDNTDYSDVISIVYKSPKGIIIISGKLTMDLDKVIEYAKYVASVPRVRTFIGSIDLSGKSDFEIQKLGKYLQNEGIKHIYLFSRLAENHTKILEEFVKVDPVVPRKSYILT